MGASESREHHDHLAEEKNVTPIQNRRILKLQDPRSPSEQINRTPIITDTTDFEDPRSPTAEICRTPVDEPIDPRSPTEGIPRTPANPFVFPDPRSPSIGVTRTPLIKTIDEREVVRESEEQSAEVSWNKVEDDGDSNKKAIKNNNTTNNAENNRLKESGDDKEKSKQIEEKDIDTKAELMEQIDTPQYEVDLAKMHLDETTSKEVQEDSQCATLVLTNSESRVKYRGNSAAKRSLRDHFQSPLTQRSPLSSRNILQNSPSSGTAGTKHHTRASHPTRLIGRYGPAGLDKENM